MVVRIQAIPRSPFLLNNVIKIFFVSFAKNITIKKNILITGASGFIGSCLVEKAIAKDYETFAVIRKNSSKQYLTNPAIKFIEVDFSSPESWDITLNEFQKKHGNIDFVIHAAGLTKSMKNQDFIDVNFTNTKNFADALIRNKIKVEKFLFVSSLAAFGSGLSADPINETQQFKPLTMYGESKMMAEDYLKTLHDFPFIIVNPTAVYGPRDKDFFFLLKSLQQGVEMYINNKKQQLSFVYVKDLVDAIFIALESKSIHKNFIVSDGFNYTSKEFNSLVKKYLNKKTISLVVPASVAYFFALISEWVGKVQKKTPILNRERLKEFKAKNWSVDATAIKQLGYTPNYNLETGLKEAIEWYKENGWLK